MSDPAGISSILGPTPVEMSVKELPITNFKIALGEGTDRLKVCTSVSALVEDILELEASLGKSLGKLGTQSLAVGGKIDWLPGYSSVWENAYKSLTMVDSKHHTNLASVLAQSITKKYPDFVKGNKKRLAAVSSKISGLVDDLKKAKAVHYRNVDKYTKLVQEVEATIRARAAVTSPTESVAGSTDARSVSTVGESSDKSDNGFMSRHMNKMLSKIAPAEKKSQEKLKDMLKEIEMSENSLQLNVTRLNNMRGELTSEITKAMAEIEELETSRLGLMKEGLLRLGGAVDLLTDKQTEAVDGVTAQTSKLASKDEMCATLAKDIERVVTAAAGSVGKKPPADADVEAAAEAAANKEIVDLLSTAENMTLAMDFLRQMAVKVTNGLLEIADVDRNYAKSAGRILERHGFTAAGEVSAGAKAGATTGQSGCSEALQQLESPQLLAGWKCVVRAFVAMAESHQRSSETLSDEIAQKLDLIQKQIDIGKRELSEQWSNNSKKYEAAHFNQEKLAVKLAKLQAFLRERRATLKAAKEEQGGAGATSTASAGNAATTTENELERDSETEDASPTPSSHTSAALSVAEDSKAGGGGKDKAERKGSVMEGFGTLGEKFRNPKMKQMMGLESSGDRILRIEKQIAVSEEEEAELTAFLKAAQATCVSVDAQIKSDLTAALATARDILTTDLETMRGTLDLLANWQAEAIGLVKTCAANVTLQQEQVSLPAELKSFVDVIRTAAQTAVVTDTLDTAASCQVLLDIPAAEVFESIRSDAIEEERKTLNANSSSGASAFANTVSAAVAANKAAGGGGGMPPAHPHAAAPKEGEVDSPLIIDTGVVSPTIVQALPAAGSSPARNDSNIVRMNTEPPQSPSYELKADAVVTLSATSTPTTSKKVPESSSDVAPAPLSDSLSVAGSPSVGISSSASTVPLHSVARTLFDEPTSSGDTAESAREALGSPASPATNGGDLTPSSPAPTLSTAHHSAHNSISSVGSQQAPTGVPPASASKTDSSKSTDTTFELAKFGLSPNDKVLESFSCALYPKKGLLTHGRMFITQHFLAFSGWPDTRVLVALVHVKSIEKSNTMGYIPNALSITMDNGDEYFFGSFIDRTPCYTLLTNLSEVAKRIVVIQGPDAPTEASTRGLEFGYQSRTNIFGSLAAAASQYLEMDGDAASLASAGTGKDSYVTSSGVVVTGTATVVPTPSRSLIGGDSSTPASPPTRPQKEHSQSTLESIPSLSLESHSLGVSEDVSAKTHVTANSPAGATIVAASVASSVSVSQRTVETRTTRRHRTPKPVLPKFSDELPFDGINLATFLNDKGIALLGEKTFDFSAADLFKAYFLDGSGYGDFLFSEGDLDIRVGEWEAMPKPQVMEDVAKLNFSHSRPYAYAHPRTTMLMFGPKNAPGTQVQYLYLPHDVSSPDALQNVRPKRGIVLNVTQFDGIPMADVFKVLQYWTFQSHPSDADKTIVRVGLAMHYIKSSLFKSQIFGGTKDELSDQLKKWYAFITKRVADYQFRLSNESEYDPADDDEVDEISDLPDILVEGAGTAGIAVVASGVTRRKSFQDGESGGAPPPSRPVSRRLSNGSARLAPSYPSASQLAAAEPTPSVVVTAAVAPPAKDLNKSLLVGTLIVFFVLILIQWSYNRSLARQITVLNAKFDARHAATEAALRESAAMLERLLRHMNVK